MADPIRITADEINCLIYSYFQDSGFKHSAFAVCMEGRLENSSNFSKHIPRGELVELLSKALLYLEVESHWKGDALSTNCKSGFSLLEPHVCSLDQPSLKPTPLPPVSLLPTEPPVKTNGTTPDSTSKRKASPVIVDGPAEKRTRRDPEEMDVDLTSESSKTKPTTREETLVPFVPDNFSLEIPSRKTMQPKPRAQGPEDGNTNPNAIRLLAGHKTEVFVCAFNPAKLELLATGSKDAVVNLWTLPNPPSDIDAPSSEPQPPLMLDYFAKTDHGDLTSLHWNTDGSLLAIGSYDSVLRICTAAGDLYFQHPQHLGPIFETQFSKSGRWLLTASLDGTACLWDVAEKRLHRQYRCHIDCCLDVDWINDTIFASCGADKTIFIMSVDEPQPIKRLLGHLNEINQIKCNSSGTRLASCSDDMTARIWNVDDINNWEDVVPGLVVPDHAVILRGHKHSVSTIGWCSDRPPGTNEMIATSSFDGTARLWDSVTGECLKVFTDHRRPVYALSFSPNGRWLATGSGDGWLHIYDVKAREKKWSWFAGTEKPGVFEIDWQNSGGINRIALALECRKVAVIDVLKIPVLRDVV